MKTKPFNLIFLSTFILSVLNAVPSKINYQGLITDGSGSPIVSTTNTIITNLYATALDEAILYSESFTDVVSNNDGIYSIQIGDSNLQTLLEENSDLWLELTINGETLSPRQLINAVPYALVAKTAESLEDGATLGNIDLTGDLSARRVIVNQTLSVDGMSNLQEVYARRLSVYGQIDGSGALVDFSNASSIRVPAPSNQGDASNKSYVDSLTTANAASITANSTSITGNTSNISTNTSNISTNTSNISANTSNISTNMSNISANTTAIAAETTAREAENALRSEKEPVMFVYDTNQSIYGFAPYIDLNSRILLVGQTNPNQNGIYTWLGTMFEGGPNRSLVRTQDFDEASEMQAGAFVFATSGESSGKGYVLTQTVADINNSSINFKRFTYDQESDAFDAATLSSKAPVQYVYEYERALSTTNYDGADYSFYNDFAQGYSAGDRILLIGQWDAEENGIYEVVDSTFSFTYITRASDLDEQNEFFGGIFVFVENGPLAGQGYVLGALHDNFQLDAAYNFNGEHDLNFSRFTVDTTQNVEFENQVTVGELIVNGPGGSIYFGGDTNQINGNFVVNGNTVDFESVHELRVPTPDQANEATNKAYVDSADSVLQADIDQNESDADTAISANTSAIAAEVTARTSAIATLQADVDQNEADADGAIATLQAEVDQNEADADVAITSLQAFDEASASQVPVLLAREWNQQNLNDVPIQYWDGNQSTYMEIGDRILIAGQGSASENGIYEVASVSGSYGSLVRAEDYDSAEEINAGDFVFVQAGDLAGQGFVLGALSESFELGVNDLNFSRFTIDTTRDVEFENRVTAGELMVTGVQSSANFDGWVNQMSGNLVVYGNSADFDVQSMRVPTPDQANEATNKAYVDSVVVPSGGLVAWPLSSPIPNGWSNAALNEPMPNFIWIQKN